MQRKFLTNLFLLLALNLLVKPLYIFGVDLGIQNLVGPDEYGIYFSMFNFSMLFNIFLDLGITNYNNRNISQYKHLLNKHFSGIITLRLMLAVVYAVVAFSVALLLGYGSRQMTLLAFLVFNQFIISSILYLRSNIAGLQLFITDSIISVLDRIVLIFLCGFMIYHHSFRDQFSIEIFVWCQTIAYLVAFFVALMVVIRKSAFKRFYWNPLFARMIVRNSFPFALLTLLMMFYFRIDSVLLERLLPHPAGARQAGIYASAFRLLDAFIMIPFLFSVLLLPMFSRMLRFKEDVRQLVSLAFPILVVFSVTISALSVGFSTEIMGFLYTEHHAESAAVFQWLMPGLIAFSISYIFGTLLTANGSLWALNGIAALSMLLNIGLNFVLIPRYQAVGSAFVSCSTLMLSALLQGLVSFRKFDLMPSLSMSIRLIVFLLGVVFVIYLQQWLPYSWMIRLLLSGSSMVLLSFAIGFVKPVRLLKIIFRP